MSIHSDDQTYYRIRRHDHNIWHVNQILIIHLCWAIDVSNTSTYCHLRFHEIHVTLWGPKTPAPQLCEAPNDLALTEDPATHRVSGVTRLDMMNKYDMKWYETIRFYEIILQGSWQYGPWSYSIEFVTIYRVKLNGSESEGKWWSSGIELRRTRQLQDNGLTHNSWTPLPPRQCPPVRNARREKEIYRCFAY